MPEEPNQPKEPEPSATQISRKTTTGIPILVHITIERKDLSLELTLLQTRLHMEELITRRTMYENENANRLRNEFCPAYTETDFFSIEKELRELRESLPSTHPDYPNKGRTISRPGESPTGTDSPLNFTPDPPTTCQKCGSSLLHSIDFGDYCPICHPIPRRE